MDSSQRALIAGIVANKVIEIFKIRNGSYPIILIGINKLLDYVVLSKFSMSDIRKYLIAAVILYPLYKYFKNYNLAYAAKWLTLNKNHHVVTITDVSIMLAIEEFIDLYPQYFDLCAELDVEEKNDNSYREIKRACVSINSSRFRRDSTFNVPELNIKGTIMYKPADNKNNLPRHMLVKYKFIDVAKTATFEAIMEKMFQMKKDTSKDENSNVTLYYTPPVTNGGTVGTIYKGKKRPMHVKEKLYLDSFFHKDKDRLWRIIKDMNNNFMINRQYCQENRISLLLHGPPGTGKSTFPYRIAMCLDRHIVSMNVNHMDRETLYQTILSPYVNGKSIDKTKCIFLLDEIDANIVDLKKRDLEKKNSTEKKTEELLKCILSQKYGDEKLSNGANSDDKKVRLSDLLNVIQGSFPQDGTIMMATTNKYDMIKTICPALFRPGRLQPVHFGYAEEETMQDISMYYFGEKLNAHVPEIHQVPTSKIIEVALELKHGNKTAEDFGAKLERLFKECL